MLRLKKIEALVKKIVRTKGREKGKASFFYSDHQDT